MQLSWQSIVDVWELREEPPTVGEADFFLASHISSDSLAEAVSLIMSKPENIRGRFVVKFGDRELRHRELENLAKRRDFPSQQIGETDLR